MTLSFDNITTLFPELPLLAQKILNLAQKTTGLEDLREHNLQKDLHEHRIQIDSNLNTNLDTTFDTNRTNNFNSHKFSNFSHIALAKSAHQILILPKDIQKIANDFWKHAFYAANICEKLAQVININNKKDNNTADPFDTELCYLLGFTHNFGFLLFGYLFRHEFRLLNKWMIQYPEEPIEKLEKRLLGMGNAMHIVHDGHTQLGAWLMEYWRLPEPFVLAAGLHHEKEYQGPYADYIQLIQLTNYLLKKIGIGEGATLSEKTLELLNISLENALVIVQDVLMECEDLFLKHIAYEIIN